ncbi:MAG TPA: lipopolysaccharide transport periplasmic protein LptA [Cellvibrio sp.]|nr:lipopolysaccharide transport periplasmic protein LptA [Cellvibrio sp.]
MNPKSVIQQLRQAQHLSLSLLSSLLLCLPFSAAQALPSDRNQEIQISSNSASIDSKQGVTILTGAVKVVQGTLEITAEKVILHYDKNQKLESLVASGAPARYQQQPDVDKPVIHAEASNITYEVSKQHVALDKNAFVEQNGATTRGGHIDYDMKSGTVSASGAGNATNRVEFVIPPQTDKKE